MPDYVWVKDSDGLEYVVTRAGLNPEIHTEVEGVDVALDANGVPYRRNDEPTAPRQSDSKAVWVDHAVSQGMDPEQAEASTKADLIADYGKE